MAPDFFPSDLRQKLQQPATPIVLSFKSFARRSSLNAKSFFVSNSNLIYFITSSFNQLNSVHNSMPPEVYTQFASGIYSSFVRTKYPNTLRLFALSGMRFKGSVSFVGFRLYLRILLACISSKYLRRIPLPRCAASAQQSFQLPKQLWKRSSYAITHSSLVYRRPTDIHQPLDSMPFTALTHSPKGLLVTVLHSCEKMARCFEIISDVVKGKMRCGTIFKKEPIRIVCWRFRRLSMLHGLDGIC